MSSPSRRNIFGSSLDKGIYEQEEPNYSIKEKHLLGLNEEVDQIMADLENKNENS